MSDTDKYTEISFKDRYKLNPTLDLNVAFRVYYLNVRDYPATNPLIVVMPWFAQPFTGPIVQMKMRNFACRR